MKKRNLAHLMITGIASGLCVLMLSASDDQSEDAKSKFAKWIEKVESTDGNITYHALAEEDLLLQLNQNTAQIYKLLSPEGKKLALEIASRSCNGTNKCKGTNACRTEHNACLGQGQCKGQTVCAISDKNLAVKLAAKKMAEKRAELQQQSVNPKPSNNRNAQGSNNNH